MVKCKTENCEGTAKTNGFCEDCFAGPWGDLVDGKNGRPMISPRFIFQIEK